MTRTTITVYEPENDEHVTLVRVTEDDPAEDRSCEGGCNAVKPAGWGSFQGAAGFVFFCDDCAADLFIAPE